MKSNARPDPGPFPVRVLAIESSCDETAVAVLERPLRVLSSEVASQISAHRPHGGVVPELAARAHLDALPVVLAAAVHNVPGGWDGIDAVAVTQGPGLSSSLVLGLGAAQALADRLNVPLLPVHHLEGHLLSVFLSPDTPPPALACPMLVLLVTGGHTALFRVDAPGAYTLLGRSIDDAAGEALDKGARLLGLPYPGGAEIEHLARRGDPERIQFPLGTPNGEEARRRGGPFPFSFSGLKTALRVWLEKHPDPEPADVAAAYQSAVMNTLSLRVRQALEAGEGLRGIACVGGVAKNALLREQLREMSLKHNVSCYQTPPEYCTDNAAMIGAVPLLRQIDPAETPPAVQPNLPLNGQGIRG